MKIFALVFFSLLNSAHASDVLVIACGEGRDAGFESAELALVDDPEASMKFYRGGEALTADEFDIAARDSGWIVTVYGAPGKLDRKFEFNQKKKTVQEFLLEEKADKKIGKAKSCTVTD